MSRLALAYVLLRYRTWFLAGWKLGAYCHSIAAQNRNLRTPSSRWTCAVEWDQDRRDWIVTGIEVRER